MNELSLRRTALGSLVVAIALLSGCANVEQAPQRSAVLCKDPHQTGGTAGVQGCTANSHCQVCGSGWVCWNASGQDDNCHNHAPGTPFTGPTAAP